MNPQQKTKAVLASEIVVFHRPNDDRSLQVAKQLKALGKKIVFDNDDSYKLVAITGRDMWQKYKRIDGLIDEFGAMADLMTCTTEFLGDEYRKLNSNVAVLKNCVDPADWPDEPLRNETDVVRIGIVGSPAQNGDFKFFKDALYALTRNKKVRVVLFGLPIKDESTREVVQKWYKPYYDFWLKLNLEWQPFVPMVKYIDTLDSLKLDIMIIPRLNTYFNKAKSNIKFLEASMLSIPCVSQGFTDGLSPYQVNPQDAKHQIIINEGEDWLEPILNLVNNLTLRRKMGEEARQYVIENYDIYKNIHLWENAYAKLLP